MKPDVLGSLTLHFGLLSLVAIGGANAVIPAMHGVAVERYAWLSDRDFVTAFALANAAPGPNVLIVTLIGLKAAGIPGALTATAAMCLPSSMLTYVVTRASARIGTAEWRTLATAALAPVTIGLIFASACTLTLSSAADHPMRLAITAASAAVLFLTRLNPLVVLASAAVAGLLGIG